jgi:4-hydroxyacetophenone monooxygenase
VSVTAAELNREEIRAGVASANVPALLMVLFQATGDDRWLRAPYTPSRGQGLGDHDSGGLPDGVQAEVRAAAVDAIARLESGEPPAIPLPSAELMARMMSICVGEPVPDGYGPLLRAEFSRRVKYPGAPDILPPEVRAPPGFRVAVIGAGVGGVVAAEQLEDMGIDYVILEKEPAAGGTWWLNTYPGAGVDTPSHLYSLAFRPHDWAMHFELRGALQAYVADALAAVVERGTVRFGTEVVSAVYGEDTRTWIVHTRDRDGV